MSFFEPLISTFERGGLVMWPIVLFSIYAAILLAERWLYYRQQDRLLSEEWRRLRAAAGTDEPVPAVDADNIAARLCSIVCDKVDGAGTTEQLDRVRNAFGDERAALEERLGTIAVIATLLPMLGLLGTVVGMIAAFDVIALHGTGNPNLMAEGISQALITTEAGLLTSIPIFYVHNLLSNRADRLVRRLDEYTTHILHRFNGETAA